MADIVIPEALVDKLEGPKYAARRAELRREAGEQAARARDRQAAAASQDEAEESDAAEERSDKRENDESGTTARGGMKVAARIGEGLRREIAKEADDQGSGWATAAPHSSP